MTKLLGLNDADPLDSATVNQHVCADPALRQNMLDHGLIYYIMGQWFLTPKGRAVMQQRARARAEARRRNLVHTNPSTAPEEQPPFEELTKDEMRSLGLKP